MIQAMPRLSEDSPQALHLAIGSVAVLLRYPAWWEAAVLVDMVLACGRLTHGEYKAKLRG